MGKEKKRITHSPMDLVNIPKVDFDPEDFDFDQNYQIRDIIPEEALDKIFERFSEGTSYRQLGTMESNIFTLIGNRMKGRRACWSTKGGDHLAKLLTLKATNRLDSKMDVLTSAVKIGKIEETNEKILGAGRVPQRVGKGYNGMHTSQIPNTEWAKGILGMKSLSEI